MTMKNHVVYKDRQWSEINKWLQMAPVLLQASHVLKPFDITKKSSQPNLSQNFSDFTWRCSVELLLSSSPDSESLVRLSSPAESQCWVLSTSSGALTMSGDRARVRGRVLDRWAGWGPPPWTRISARARSWSVGVVGECWRLLSLR